MLTCGFDNLLFSTSSESVQWTSRSEGAKGAWNELGVNAAIKDTESLVGVGANARKR